MPISNDTPHLPFCPSGCERLLLDDLGRIDELPWGRWREESRAGVFAETVGMLKARSAKPVCAFVTAPFTLAGLLMGVENILLEAAMDHGYLPELYRRCATATGEHVAVLEEAGADMVCLLDPSAMMLGPNLYGQHAAPYVRSVVEAMEVPAVLHICGDTRGILGRMADTGAAVLSLDSAVPLDVAAGLVPDDTALMGNLSPAFCASAGATAVAHATTEMIRRVPGGRRYIASTGCDLPIHTRVENIVSFVEASRSTLSGDRAG